MNAADIGTKTGELTLSAAVLIYNQKTRSGGEKQGFVSIHDIGERDGAAVVLPGVPATRQALRSAMQSLMAEKFVPEILPAHVLSKGHDHLVWYRLPCKRKVWFKCDKLGGEVSAEVPHPGIVFIAIDDELHLFAYKGKDRPDASTQLFMAPYFNVWSPGKVCIGNCDHPKGDAALDAGAWESMFYNSWFTHPNVQKLVKARKGAYAFWKELLDGKHEKFPQAALLPLDVTLGDAFAKVMGAQK